MVFRPGFCLKLEYTFCLIGLNKGMTRIDCEALIILWCSSGFYTSQTSHFIICKIVAGLSLCLFWIDYIGSAWAACWGAIVLWGPLHGHRRRGRPYTTFVDTLKRDLGATSIPELSPTWFGSWQQVWTGILHEQPRSDWRARRDARLRPSWWWWCWRWWWWWWWWWWWRRWWYRIGHYTRNNSVWSKIVYRFL